MGVEVVLREGVGRFRASSAESSALMAPALLPSTFTGLSVANVRRAAEAKSKVAARKEISRGMPEAAERRARRAKATETFASVSACVPGKRMRPLTTGCPTTGRPVCVEVAVALGEVEVVAVGNAVGRVAVGLLEAAAEALTERVAAEALAMLDCRCVVEEAGLSVRAWDTVCVGLCAEESEEVAEGVGVLVACGDSVPGMERVGSTEGA